MHLPYTYLLVWKDTNVKYYGVRYARGCHPGDLWSTYFTSSKEVSKYRLLHGEPDIIQIRKTFYNISQARIWEHKVLRRLKCASRPDYLNLTDAISIPHYSGEEHPMYGKSREDLHKLRETKWYNNGIVNKRLRSDDVPSGFVLGRMPYDTSKVVSFNKSRKGTYKTEHHKSKISNTLKGRKQTATTRKKKSDALKGKTKSEAARRNMSIAARNRSSQST